jgi:hypothetical protein
MDTALQTFIDDVARMVETTDDEYEITALVAERLSALLASDQLSSGAM